jgi:hypothetical protein
MRRPLTLEKVTELRDSLPNSTDDLTTGRLGDPDETRRQYEKALAIRCGQHLADLVDTNGVFRLRPSA